MPKHIEILAELPKTAIGKVFKPDLRKSAIARVYGEALGAAGIAAEVVGVSEVRKRGLVAHIRRTGPVDDAAAQKVLGEFAVAWDWVE